MRKCLQSVYKEERLDFTSYRIANEEDHSIKKATEAASNELVSSAKCDGLLNLLRYWANNSLLLVIVYTILS